MHSSKSSVNPCRVINFTGEAQSISLKDRGLQYGDGFFTTALLLDGQVHHWSYHWQRIESSLSRLGFPELAEGFLQQQLTSFVFSTELEKLAVLKIMITRGEGGQAYLPLEKPNPTIIMEILPFPNQKASKNTPSPPVITIDNLAVCEVFASVNPTLAGLKHLNRLDNVLAKQTLSQKGFEEGLMFDVLKHLVSATTGNVLLYNQGRWLTPKLDQAGVKGTALAFLKTKVEIQEAELTLDDCIQAEAICITNAVKGVMPVKQFQGSDKNMQPVECLINIWQQSLLGAN